MAEAPSSVGLINIINLMREENNVRNESIKQSQEGTEKNTSDLNKTMREILEEIKQDRLQNEEDRRESKKQAKEKGKDSVSPMKAFEIDWPAFSWTAMIGGIIAAFAGFVQGLINGWVGAIKDVMKALGRSIRTLFRGMRIALQDAFRVILNTFRALGRGLEKMFGIRGRLANMFNRVLNSRIMKPIMDGVRGVQRFFRGVSLFFTNLRVAFNSGFNGLTKLQVSLRQLNGRFKGWNAFDKIARGIGKAARVIKSAVDGVSFFFFAVRYYATIGFDKLRSIGRMLLQGTRVLRGLDAGVDLGRVGSGIGRAFRVVKSVFGTAFSAVKAILSPITSVISNIFGKAGVLGKFFGSIFRIFRVFGRFIAWPITVIMGIYDGIMGFIDGWQSREGEGIFNQIIGGISGALGGILSGLVGVPLDLLKDLVSWIASKLGFENFSEWLDSFSFADMISDMFNALGQMWIDIKDWVVGLFDAEDPVGYIIDGLTGLLDKVTGFFSDMWEGLTSFLSRAWRGRPTWLGGDGTFSLSGGSSSSPASRTRNDAIGDDTPPPRDTSYRTQTRTRTRSAGSGSSGSAAADNLNFDITPTGDRDADVEKILSTIRLRESGGDYTVGQNAGASSASGAYQFLDGTWQTLTRNMGIGQQYTRAKFAPPEIQDEVARRYVQDILRRSGGDIRAVPNEWYTGNIEGRMTERQLAANNGLTSAQYTNRWLNDYNGGVGAPSSSSRTNAGTMLAQFGNGNAGNGGNAFASFNFGGNSNTSVSNTTNTQSTIAPVFDVDAAFGPFATSANALFGAA
jgi:hypothetical protein